MKRILREQAKEYAFDRSLPPKLRVNPVERFILETEDAASRYLREEGQSPLNRPFTDETWPPSVSRNSLSPRIFLIGVWKKLILLSDVTGILASVSLPEESQSEAPEEGNA